MKVFLKVFAVAAFLAVMIFVAPMIDARIHYVEWFVGKFFLVVAGGCMLAVAFIAYPWAFVRGWKDRKLDMPDRK